MPLPFPPLPSPPVPSPSLLFSFFSSSEMGFCFVSEAGFELLDVCDCQSKELEHTLEHCAWSPFVLILKSTSSESDFLCQHI